jgi:hypothetical protein
MTWPTSAQTPQLDTYALPLLIARPVGIVNPSLATTVRLPSLPTRISAPVGSPDSRPLCAISST